MGLSTIILAGGKGARFQKTGHAWIDKLLAEIEGKSLIKWVYECVKPLSSEIIISTNTYQRGIRYKEILGDEDIKIVEDKVMPCKGPLLGIASSAGLVESEKVLVIPADMPFIKTESVEKLVNGLNDYDVTVPLWYDGMTENLFFVAKRNYLQKVSRFLCSKSYWSPSGIIRGAPVTYYMDASKIVESPKELININYFADLEDIKPRKELMEGKDVLLRNDFISLEEGMDDVELAMRLNKTNNVFLTAVVFSYLGMNKDRVYALRGVKAFDMEARRYYDNEIYGLMALAYLDAGKILKNTGYQLLAEQYLEKADRILKILNAYPKKRFI